MYISYILDSVMYLHACAHSGWESMHKTFLNSSQAKPDHGEGSCAHGKTPHHGSIVWQKVYVWERKCQFSLRLYVSMCFVCMCVCVRITKEKGHKYERE